VGQTSYINKQTLLVILFLSILLSVYEYLDKFLFARQNARFIKTFKLNFTNEEYTKSIFIIIAVGITFFQIILIWNRSAIGEIFS
jgi:hypothetical protein